MNNIAVMIVVLALAAGSAPLPTESTSTTATGCKLCDDVKAVACPTCSGKGRTVQECSACRGTGKSACAWCPPVARVAAEKLNIKLKHGFLPCPNKACDRAGMMRWDDGSKDPCQVCAGHGTYKCPMCSDGIGPCHRCGGKGRYDATCGDCFGAGKIPCPACTAKPESEACPLCEGARKRACALCAPGQQKRGDTGGATRCIECAGAGFELCASCYGLGKVCCSSCAGCGAVRSKIIDTGSKAGKKRCDTCKGAGTRPCEECKGGKKPCRAQCDTGAVTRLCVGCADEHSVTCHGCIPWIWSGYDTCGRVLHRAGRFDEAVAYYDHANRLASLVVVSAQGFEEAPTLKAQIEAILRKSRSQVEAALKLAKEKKPLTGSG